MIKAFGVFTDPLAAPNNISSCFKLWELNTKCIYYITLGIATLFLSLQALSKIGKLKQNLNHENKKWAN